MLEGIRDRLERKAKESRTALRIAQIAPLIEAVPPRLYGGTERIVSNLADSLVERGQDVTLFATGDASTNARLIAVRKQAIRLDPAPLKSELAAAKAELDRLRALSVVRPLDTTSTEGGGGDG